MPVRPSRPLLIPLTALACFGSMLLVRSLHQTAYDRAHPPAGPEAAIAEIPEMPRPTPLSALELLRRDPPRGDTSAGALSLQDAASALPPVVREPSPPSAPPATTPTDTPAL